MRLPLADKRISTTPGLLVLAASLYLTACLNLRFFMNVSREYPLTEHPFFLFSLALLILFINLFLVSLFGFRRSLKPFLVVIFPLAAAAAYFMDSYNVILDVDMIRNAMMTDSREVADLLNVKLFLYVVLLGLLPAWVVYRHIELMQPIRAPWLEFLKRLGLTAGSLLMIVIIVLVSRQEFAFFFREHKALREYANPVYPLYSVVGLAGQLLTPDPGPIQRLGEDARMPQWDEERELIVLVVGETVRADRLSLNGYARSTTPILEQAGAYSFSNVWSCGTSTGVSVPCMFSRRPDHDFDTDAAAHEENLLDVLAHADVNLLWRDNNSSSKGVADRVPYEDWRSPERNPVCDTECRDVGMLSGLQEYIDSRKQGDIVIVLHQMGNHGPAYYKRYPEEFEQYTPVCKSSQLTDCTRQEIDNAYDNALRYTDYFLGQVIEFLRGNERRFETVMMYVSDHGESLGEEGLYLHGLPYEFSPETQRHVPVVFWFGKNYHDVDRNELKTRLDDRYTHGNIFDTVLGLLEIESEIYHRDEDMLLHVDDPD